MSWIQLSKHAPRRICADGEARKEREKGVGIRSCLLIEIWKVLALCATRLMVEDSVLVWWWSPEEDAILLSLATFCTVKPGGLKWGHGDTAHPSTLLQGPPGWVF